MKLSKLSLTVVVAALILSTLAPQPQAATDYCVVAKDSCSELQFAVFMNCINNGGEYQQCKCNDLRAFNACMAQFGCPGKSEQFMLESGCGPD